MIFSKNNVILDVHILTFLLKKYVLKLLQGMVLLLHLLETTFNQKCISANCNPKAQCFWTDEMTSFFEHVYNTRMPWDVSQICFLSYYATVIMTCFLHSTFDSNEPHLTTTF